MTDNIKFHGPLMKELQRCAAFRAYEHIMSSGTTVGGSDLEEAHLNLYFSDVDEDHVGFAEQLVKGTGMFNALYNEINGELVMKELYHCLPGKKIYSNASNTQGAINMAVMSSKNLSNRVKLKKRVIVTMAKETLKFGKKALAIVKRSDYYRTYMATSSFPSGKNYEDYCHFVREEMFKAREDLAKLDKLNPEEAERVINREAEAETEGEGAYDVDDSAEAHINEEEEKMPDNFTFKGYNAFVLWGPIPPPEYAGNDDFMATAYAAKYRKTLKADGRAAARVSEEREAAKERSQATSTQARGIPKEELFFQCQIAAHRGWQQSQTDLREKEITFTNINNRIQQLGRAVMDTQGYFPPQWFLHPEDHMDNVLFQRTYMAMNKRFDALDHQGDLLVNHEEQIKAKIASREAGNTEEGNIFNTFIDRTLEPMMAPVLRRSSGAQGTSVRSESVASLRRSGAEGASVRSESVASLRRSIAEGASVRSESVASLRRSGVEGASVRSESVTYETHDTPSTGRKETNDGDDSSIGGSEFPVSEASDASIESTMEETQRTMELKRKNPDISTERIGVPPTLLLSKNEHNKKRKQRKP
ncbi:hypothetical protein IV203_030431 [Nitzschia inconspicua]|uniref:Uncharacterized protein n=1 Tax=Nitzschia inconspicua TaxID=303405 RepID=A0A9K3K8D4_9STRA|nr:hypothetical protein IV203_025028 [Nitzschia inconspicua]KAG7339019.1 hypothetical protein IV203_028356 [Nitzschia inconspicua]KAG7339857.1 hypothetical protein IV203_024907 [Nitzschia inconspicua]KAG7367760.1 hypothetical protein IV203_030431 [Nitzschia inconspicua]